METLAWLNTHEVALKAQAIHVESRMTDTKKYFLGKPEIDISIQEKQDWFDIVQIYLESGNHKPSGICTEEPAKP